MIDEIDFERVLDKYITPAEDCGLDGLSDVSLVVRGIIQERDSIHLT